MPSLLERAVARHAAILTAGARRHSGNHRKHKGDNIHAAFRTIKEPQRRAAAARGATRSTSGSGDHVHLAAKGSGPARVSGSKRKPSFAKTVSKKRRLASDRLSEDFLAGLVGTAQESDLMHATRHPPEKIRSWANSCPRCAFILWCREHTCPKWMVPKPRFESGAWGLGCTWCNAGRQSDAVSKRRRFLSDFNRKAGLCKQAICRTSTWCNYNVLVRALVRFMQI